MSTRGFIGFVADGAEKISYCHNDAHPEGLGLDVLRWLRGIVTDGDHGLTGLAEAATALRVVSPDSVATAEDVVRYERYADPMGAGPVDDWYRLLRRTQGDPAMILEAGVVVDSTDILTARSSKWGYVIDTDAGTLDVHRFRVYGDMGSAPIDEFEGRFAGRGPVPCVLLASWSLDLLPTDAEFLAALSETVPA